MVRWCRGSLLCCAGDMPGDILESTARVRSPAADLRATWSLPRELQRKEACMAKVQKSTDSSSLAEVVDRILDKGIVIDAFVKVSLVGIELLSIEARVVIASVETYLKYAEAIGLTATAANPN